MPPKKPPARPRRVQAATGQDEHKREESQAEVADGNAHANSQQILENASPVEHSSISATTAGPSNHEASERSIPNTNSSSRGRGGGARPLIRPRGIGRRSVQGRAELERAEAERKKAEAAVQTKSTARARRDGVRPRGSGNRRRGGYAGENERGSETIVSGPFSLGEVRKAEGRRAYSGGGRATGGSSGSRGERGDAVASSSGTQNSSGRSGRSQIKQESGANNDAAMTDVYIKQEDTESISSDADEEGTERRKLNIDDPIDLTIDDDDADSTYLLPVRIQRVEHKERALLANAESAKSNDRIAPAKVSHDQYQSHSPDRRRAKQRTKDVEITGSSHKYRGTYSDSSEEELVEVKTEPMDVATPLTEITPQERPVSPEIRRAGKEKARTESTGRDAKVPHFATVEEEVEWSVRERDLRILRAELGDTAISAVEENTHDEVNPRADKVYLFQMPAVLPALKPVVPKLEDEDIEMRDASAQQSAREKKVESTTRELGGAVKTDTDLPTGLIGKLKIHASGRAVLDWGGIPLEVSMGQEASFLQDVLLMDKVASKPHSNESSDVKEGGSAMSMGQVKGKFVVVPDWNKVFEQAA